LQPHLFYCGLASNKQEVQNVENKSKHEKDSLRHHTDWMLPLQHLMQPSPKVENNLDSVLQKQHVIDMKHWQTRRTESRAKDRINREIKDIIT